MGVGAGDRHRGRPGLLWFMRRVPLPGEGLYPLRTLASALLLFGAATLAHGSGFLAVFVAGIVLGDERAPYKREIERFHTALASLGEIVAFAVLGLTVDLTHARQDANVLVPGLVLGAVVAVRHPPAAVGLCLTPARLAGARADLRPVRRAQGSRADPARRADPRSPRTSRTPNGCTESSPSW